MFIFFECVFCLSSELRLGANLSLSARSCEQTRILCLWIAGAHKNNRCKRDSVKVQGPPAQVERLASFSWLLVFSEPEDCLKWLQPSVSSTLLAFVVRAWRLLSFESVPLVFLVGHASPTLPSRLQGSAVLAQAHLRQNVCFCLIAAGVLGTHGRRYARWRFGHNHIDRLRGR